MTDFIEHESGLVVPAEPPKPQRKYGLLELQSVGARKTAQSSFQHLLDSDICRQGMIVLEPSENGAHKARQELVLTLARLFLGDDFSWEEKC